MSDSEETAVFNTSGPNMAVTPEEATPSGRNREQPVPPPGDHQKQKLATLQTTLGTVQAERDIIRKVEILLSFSIYHYNVNRYSVSDVQKPVKSAGNLRTSTKSTKLVEF